MNILSEGKRQRIPSTGEVEKLPYNTGKDVYRVSSDQAERAKYF